eukprot:c25339_g3_i1 orf=147-404(-)
MRCTLRPSSPLLQTVSCLVCSASSKGAHDVEFYSERDGTNVQSFSCVRLTLFHSTFLHIWVPWEKLIHSVISRSGAILTSQLFYF